MKLKIEERYISYFHKPIAQGGLLPLHHGDGGDVVGGDGGHAGSAPPEFPPSDLQVQVSVLWFLCLRPPPPIYVGGGGYFYSRF